jgi:hypothetical protein
MIIAVQSDKLLRFAYSLFILVHLGQSDFVVSHIHCKIHRLLRKSHYSETVGARVLVSVRIAQDTIAQGVSIVVVLIIMYISDQGLCMETLYICPYCICIYR